MVPILTLPNVSVPPPPMAETFTGVPTQTSALARIPFNAVPSNGDPGTIYNNGRNTANFAGSGTARQVPNPSVGINAARGLIPPGVQTTQSGFFASSFVAQVMGQGGAAQNGDLFSSFFSASQPKSPTPDIELLERFSLTKYKPSEAARPAPQPQGTAALANQLNAQESAGRITQERAAVQAAQLQQSQQTAAGTSAVQSQASVGGASAAASSPATRAEPASGNNRSQPERSNTVRFTSSLIRPRGVDAYIATFSRNLMNLGTVSGEDPIRIFL